ncbi:unknown [[Mannheimia] succiniciproducens MBEL55E]|uniref:Uncharacterized protein n=1 Tax=Mannheimia succiniciproducens (strain KCTC 0769BP / MBEL55E) TaxID=221988 RepID=Q65RU7_MANSM|nr:unknown [[Mannheimia] succiniciproducens MBEL55E]
MKIKSKSAVKIFDFLTALFLTTKNGTLGVPFLLYKYYKLVLIGKTFDSCA